MAHNEDDPFSTLTITDFYDNGEFNFDAVAEYVAVLLNQWDSETIETISSYAKQMSWKSGFLVAGSVIFPAKLSFTNAVIHWVGYISLILLVIYGSIYTVMTAIESPDELLNLDDTESILRRFVLLTILGTAYYARKNQYAKVVWNLLFRDAPYTNTGKTISDPKYLSKIYSIRNKLFGIVGLVAAFDILLQLQLYAVQSGSTPENPTILKEIEFTAPAFTQIELVTIYIIGFIASVIGAFILSVIRQT
jgi:hypothetical protein